MSNPLALVKKDGHTMAVIRPEDPERALRRSKEALTKDGAAGFNAVLSEQTYTWIGLLRKDGKIVNLKRKVVDKIQPGDSLVSFKELREAGFEIQAVSHRAQAEGK